MQAAYRAYPERFPHGMPTLPPLPHAVWINKPVDHAGAALAEPAYQRAPKSAQAGDADASKLLVLTAPSSNSLIELAQ